MFINHKTFYGIDEPEISHLRKHIIPVWKEDKEINPMLLSMAQYLIGAGFNGEFRGENEDIAFCRDIPKYIFTKTTNEIISKINITGKTISMIEEVDTSTNIEYAPDVFAHISFNREFYRYMIVASNIYVVHCYLYDNNGIDNVGYSVWHIGLGGKPEDYKVENWEPYCIRFLQILMFLKYTEPEVKVIPSGKKVGTKKNGYYNLTRNDVQVVDSSWNTTVVRSEGFSVDGHLRLQPFGEGRKKRKLIWIEPFAKSGYVRNAKSTI